MELTCIVSISVHYEHFDLTKQILAQPSLKYQADAKKAEEKAAKAAAKDKVRH